jgi:pyruvate,water dikinase
MGTPDAFRQKYENFKILLESNAELLGIMADIETKLGSRLAFGPGYMEAVWLRSLFHTGRMIRSFAAISGRPQAELEARFGAIGERIGGELPAAPETSTAALVIPYGHLGAEALPAVGGKNANLAEVGTRLGLPIPQGFAITTAAFERFLAHNRLAAAIAARKQKLDIYETETIVAVGAEIRRMIETAEVPGDLQAAIVAAVAALRPAADGQPRRISVRSSAIGEDGALSFAGQYATRLNVAGEEIVDAYKEIVASLFSDRAIAYRLHMGFAFQAAAMAVACQEMIAAEASGVMYTRNPIDAGDDRILIRAVWGLGPYAVDGVVPPDRFVLSKDPVPALLEREVSRKPVMLAINADGNLGEAGVEARLQAAPALSDEAAGRLAAYGMAIEQHFGAAQDVEWALDNTGRLVILQARPLRVNPAGSPVQGEAELPADGHPVLLSGGETACPGVGAGPVFAVRNQSDLIAFPEGAVLVAPHSSPQLVMVMDRARAIVTEAGNVAGHMACLAREYMVPTLVNLPEAAQRLIPGALVTVDADHGRIYEGRVASLVERANAAGDAPVDGPAHRALKRRAERILPLHLVDPKSAAFAPRNCLTIHDIMRYIHEKAYEALFQLGDQVAETGQGALRLEAPLPIDLYLIDLGGGLCREAAGLRAVAMDQVRSVPLKALVAGMMEAWAGEQKEPRPVDFGGFWSVMGRQLLDPPRLGSERFGDRSYGIVSDVYLNFSSRVGYHYSILDSFCSANPAKNYINFEFKGGAADAHRRHRRVRVIQRVLVDLGFWVDAVGDRVTARLSKQPADLLAQRLHTLGRLLIQTRQMDMLMADDAMVDKVAMAIQQENRR